VTTCNAPVTTYDARLADGRRLTVNLSGDLQGEPVFYLHGTPGSRIGPRPSDQELMDRHVWLISFDRPGYGRSDRLQSRTVADIAPDVKAIADELGLDQFAVLGRSGGGPHALACAALLPHRVTRAAALVSLAPWQAPGLDWFDGMAKSNRDAYTIAARNPKELGALLRLATQEITADPASHIAVLTPEMPEADRRIVADGNVRALLEQNFFEGLRISAEGWIDDVLAFCSPWGFDVSEIKVPVYLWHGGRDVFSPVAHTKWLAKRILGARCDFPPDRAHFGALEVVPDVLYWLSGRTEEVQTGKTRPVYASRLAQPRSLNNLVAWRVGGSTAEVPPDRCPDEQAQHVTEEVKAWDALRSHRRDRSGFCQLAWQGGFKSHAQLSFPFLIFVVSGVPGNDRLYPRQMGVIDTLKQLLSARHQ
jgi:pimeloyl-ACP methyl ester carboxylesterase